MNFTGRSVMITGAAGNLGRAVAAQFAQQGARVALLDLKLEALPLALQPGAQVLHLPTDLLQPAQVQAAVSATLERFGRIDVLCNLAGGFRMGEAVHETTDATWNFLFDLNTRSLLNMARAVVPAMLTAGGGAMVNVGAQAALRGGARMSAYAASKSTVIRLTESLSAELGARGIRVNCVLPSIIDTPENRRDMPDADFSRWVQPAALAEVIAFLASDAARAIHGAALPVSGLV